MGSPSSRAYQRILVAAWGDPFTWSEATYLAGDERVRSRSSLAAVARAEGTGSGLRVIVYAQETLLAADRARRYSRKVETCDGRVVGREECRILERPYKPIHSTSNYPELLKDLGRAVSEYAESLLEEAGVRPASVEAVIAPGVGPVTYLDEACRRRRARWILPFNAQLVNMFTYYEATLTLHLASKLMDPSLEGPLRLVVDLTHGVNYTVAATYRAALYAARLRAAAFHETVEVALYNSEPYKPEVELALWRVREERIHPKTAASRLVYAITAYTQGGLATPTSLTAIPRGSQAPLGAEEKSRLALTIREAAEGAAEGACSEWKEALSQGVNSSASIAYGGPLLLLEAGRRVNEACGPEGLRRLVIEVSNTLLELLEYHGRKVLPGYEGEVRILHQAALSRDKVKAFLAQASLALYAANAFEAGKSWGTVRTPLTGGAAATPAALHKVVEEYLAGPAYLTAAHEISMVEKNLRPEKSGDKAPCESKAELYQRLSSLASECREGIAAGPAREPEKCDGVNHRIFAAHAGLNSDIVEAVCVKIGDRVAPALSYTSRFLNCLSRGWAAGMLKQLSGSLGLEAWGSS